jgi:uncharacterized RDD family membrane protein YckC
MLRVSRDFMSITPIPDVPPEPEGIQRSAMNSYLGAPGALEGVTFWPRVGARIIDTIINYVVALCGGLLLGIVVAIVAAMQHASGQAFFSPKPRGIAFYVIPALGFVIFEALCEGLHGSTPGKLMLSMVVVQEDGSPCRMGSAWIRSFAYFIDGLFFGLIAYLCMQKSPQEQRHGDEWAHTVVCRRSQVAPQNLRGFGRFALVFFLAALIDAACVILGVVVTQSS